MLCRTGSLGNSLEDCLTMDKTNKTTRDGVPRSTTLMMLSLVLLITLVFYIYFTFYKKSKRFMEMANKLPGPRCFPIIGSAYVFGTSAEAILQNVVDICNTYGDVSGHWVGPLFYVAVQKAYDLEMIIGNSNMLAKTTANNLMKSAMGNGLITSSVDLWKKHRKILQPTFHSQILRDYISVFISKSKILNSVLESQVDKGDFDICTFVNNYAYDILCETLFSSQCNEQLSGKQAQFVTSLNISGAVLTSRFFKPWMYVDYIFYKTTSGKDFRTNMAYLHNSTKKIIQQKLLRMKTEATGESNGFEEENGKVKRKSFLDYLLEVAPKNGLTETHVLDEANTMIMAGFDTTASALGFLCFIISKRFDLQEKLVEEIKEVLGTLEEVPFTYEDIQRFTYLDRVVKETLRVFPTIPYVARQITEDTKLPSGYTLPVGCGVIIPFVALHRDPEFFPNPHVFDPDNFLPERVAERHPYAYCPFSAGPRNCIGQKYAMLELKTFLICLLRRFWLTPTDFKLQLLSRITMNSQTGMKIGITRRTVERPAVKNYEILSKGITTSIDFLNVRFKESYS